MNKSLYDNCNLTQKQKDNFSIFNYYTDISMYKNNSNSPNTSVQNSTGTPPIDLLNIENDLKNITRNNSKCANNKYTPTKYL